MPEIKKYDGKKAKNQSPKPGVKRRPHREIENVEEEINTDALNEGASAAGAEDMAAEFQSEPMEMAAEPQPEHSAFSSDSELPKEEKVRLEFYGSDILRMKAPKAMELADIVADEWVKDGQFHGLPLGSPIAQVAASMALRKAKDVEKKLDEKGVFTMAKVGIEFVKSKIDKKN